jgi:hypothetical protein
MRRGTALALAALAAALIAPSLARVALPVQRGLTTQPFTTVDRIGTRSFGYVTTFRGGRFRFEVTSTVPVTLQVNGGSAADLALDAGAHFVLIEQIHEGPAPGVELRWARGDAAFTPLPGWRLSPSRVEPWRVLLLRALEWLRVAAAIALVLIAGRAVAARWGTPLSRVAGHYPRTAALLLFTTLAVAHTWPLATAPSRLSRYDNSDAMLNEWAIAWFAHQAVRDPLHLFDANIFFPERKTLAYSEAMLVQGAMAAPLIWAGASSLAAYNMVLIAGFALTGWATALVAARWTGDWVAGLVAGIIAAFNAHTLTRLPHLQALHVEFLPLALAALDALMRGPRLRHALSLGGWFALQGLASLYLLVFSAIALTAAALARPRDWLGRSFPRVGAAAALAAVIAIVLLSPYLLTYWQVHREQSVVRTLIDLQMYSASWADYVSSPARLHFNTWSHRWFTGSALFPGVAALALTAAAFLRGVAWRDPRARMCLAFGAAGLVLSFGTKLPGYASLYQMLTPLQAIRAVSRIGYLAILAIAFLAAFGVAAVRARVPHARWPAAAAAILIAVALEPTVAPIHFAAFAGVSPIYASIATDPTAVVAELPMPGGTRWFGNAHYMINATRHWRPMLNGYSGFAPLSFHRHAAALASFPSPDATAALRSIGVTHVFVHLDAYSADQRSQIDNNPALERIQADDRIVLYRVAAP